MLNPDQAPRFRPVASAAQDRHLVVEERVKAINNPRRTELAGSVWIRYATATRLACWRRESIC